MSQIPFHDDQMVPPAERQNNLFKRIAAQGFFVERDAAFSVSMEVRKLTAFFDKYKIHYSDPRMNPERFPENGKKFWAMCYTAVLIANLGTEETFERANIWLHVHRSKSQTYVVGQGIIGYHLDWDVKAKTYTVNRKNYMVPPLLTKKRPE